MKFFIVSFISLFAIASQAENYFVEPLICKGAWNATPTGYHPSYQYAAVTVISFKTVKAKDCSLVNSSSTQVDFGKEEMDAKSIDQPVDSIGGWFSGPLQKNGQTVELPFGVWSNSMTLTITSSSTLNNKQIDTLSGRSEIFNNFYYELSCQAIVVKDPSYIENNTKNCK